MDTMAIATPHTAEAVQTVVTAKISKQIVRMCNKQQTNKDNI